MSERDIFTAALQKEDPVGRRAYLDEACAGQPELRQQVENLLRLHEGAGSFLDKPAAGGPVTGAFPDAAEQAAAQEPPAKASARTSSFSKSARAAWARSGWPSRPSRS